MVEMMNNFEITRKRLTNILLVQWSRFGAVPIKIQGSTLFTGVNGSGKSTILDAMTYVYTGNTQFNIAAKDKDRSVLSYVRGDTKSKGQDQYLRKGNVISYIAMEFYAPADSAYITIGVCIESPDEQSFSPYWFICKNAKISDFNFYKKNGKTISVTPRNELRNNNGRLKATDFWKKEKGIEKAQRVLGLRCKSDVLHRKIMKMVTFKPENNIDKFIRDSVLPEQKIETLYHIREQQQQFTKIKETYSNILKLQQLLESVEEKATEYEKTDRAYNLKCAEYYYQQYDLAKSQLEETQKKLEDETSKHGRLKADYEEAEKHFREAEKRKNEAEINCKNNDLAAQAEELEKQLEDLNSQLEIAKNNLSKIQTLQSSVLESINISGLDAKQINTLTKLESTDISPDEKYAALSALKKAVDAKIDNIKWSIKDNDKKLEELEDEIRKTGISIKKLEQNLSDYPEYVSAAIDGINSELKAMNIDAKVRTFAELVKSVDKPEWRDALEIYLRNNKFNLIIDSQYTSQALEIFHRKGFQRITLILTDKLEDYTAEPNSAAQILTIPNQEARKYANYLLGRLILCETLDELHDHPKGGIMKDGTVARGMGATNNSLKRVEYFIGQDAVKLQLQVRKKELEELNKQKNELEKTKEELKTTLKIMTDYDFNGEHYHFEAVNIVPETTIRISRITASLNELRADPTLTALSDQLNAATKAYKDADKKRLEINGNLEVVNKEKRSLSEYIERLTASVESAESQFNEFIFLHLELKKEAVSEYEKLKKVNPNGIAVAEKTITNYGAERKNAITALETAQINYCNLAGRSSEERGISYIAVYRAERNKLNNVDAEETKNKLSEKQKELESAFVTDFIASLCESLNNAKTEINAINNELSEFPFAQDIYSFTAVPSKEKAAFFRIKDKLYEYDPIFDTYRLRSDFSQRISDDQELKQDIEDFLETILREADDEEYTDYRTYYVYDMQILNKATTHDIITDLSEKQGSASNGEKQTPYFIILAASLMQCYPKNSSCARLAFIDEAFAALSQERIEQMVKYFEQNGFQVMYAAPPEKINSIGKHIDSTVSLVEAGRYTYALEGLADEIIKHNN